MCGVHNLKHPVIAADVSWHAMMKTMDGTLQSQKQREMLPQVPHNSNFSSNSLLFTFPPTKPTMLMSHLNITITQNHCETLSFLFCLLEAMVVSPQCWPLAWVSPSVSVASCTQSSRQSKQMSLCCLVQGNASFEVMGVQPSCGHGCPATQLSLAEL